MAEPAVGRGFWFPRVRLEPRVGERHQVAVVTHALYCELCRRAATESLTPATEALCLNCGTLHRGLNAGEGG